MKLVAPHHLGYSRRPGPVAGVQQEHAAAPRGSRRRPEEMQSHEPLGRSPGEYRSAQRRGHPMSSKESAAVSQLLALLEARYALRVLWALRDGHAQTFRLLQ